MIYQDDTACFKQFLIKDGSVTIHQQNLQFLAIANGIAQRLIEDIFSINESFRTEHLGPGTR